MTVDYLNLRPSTVETPAATYRLYWFRYQDGRATIQTVGRAVLLTATGTLEHPADQEWVFTSYDGEKWSIAPGGCACGRAAIIPKTAVPS